MMRQVFFGLALLNLIYLGYAIMNERATASQKSTSTLTQPYPQTITVTPVLTGR